LVNHNIYAILCIWFYDPFVRIDNRYSTIKYGTNIDLRVSYW